MPGSQEQESGAKPDHESDVAPSDPDLGVSVADPQPEPATDASGDDTTVGTGTSIALGCIAGTLLLVVIGLIFLGILFILG